MTDAHAAERTLTAPDGASVLPLTEQQCRLLHRYCADLTSEGFRRRKAPAPLLRWALHRLGAEIQMSDRDVWAHAASFTARAQSVMSEPLAPWYDGAPIQMVEGLLILAAGLRAGAAAQRGDDRARLDAIEARYPDVPFCRLHEFLLGELARGPGTPH